MILAMPIIVISGLEFDHSTISTLVSTVNLVQHTRVLVDSMKNFGDARPGVHQGVILQYPPLGPGGDLGNAAPG